MFETFHNCLMTMSLYGLSVSPHANTGLGRSRSVNHALDCYLEITDSNQNTPPDSDQVIFGCEDAAQQVLMSSVRVPN